MACVVTAPQHAPVSPLPDDLADMPQPQNTQHCPAACSALADPPWHACYYNARLMSTQPPPPLAPAGAPQSPGRWAAALQSRASSCRPAACSPAVCPQGSWASAPSAPPPQRPSAGSCCRTAADPQTAPTSGGGRKQYGCVWTQQETAGHSTYGASASAPGNPTFGIDVTTKGRVD